MATTYTLIASSTVGSGGTSTIDFTSIPNTYTDLLIKLSARSSVSAVGDNIKININSKGNNTGITVTHLGGNGSSVSSNTAELMVINGATSTSSTFNNGELYFPNYLSSSNKTFSSDMVTENNGTTGYNFLDAVLWSYTEAITSISIVANSGTFVQYSTAYLYGIKKS